MPLSDFFLHDVTIYTLSDSTADRYGNPTSSESSASTVARIQATTPTEFLIGRDTRISNYTALLPAATAITSTSEVGYDGKRYRVIGEPKVANGAAAPHHKVAYLELIAG